MFIQILCIALGLAPATDKSNYVVEARFMNGEKSVRCPKLSVCEGQSGTMTDYWQEPFVTAIKIKRGREEPVITVLTGGVSVNFTVTAIDDHNATLDATVQVTKIVDVQERRVDNKSETTVQSPRQESFQVRVLQPIRLGNPTHISLGPWSERSVEFVVRTQEGYQLNRFLDACGACWQSFSSQ